MVTHAVACQVFPFGDDADAAPIAKLREIPEPALVRNKCHRRRPFSYPRLPFRAFVIGPHRDLVQAGVPTRQARLFELNAFLPEQ